MTYRTGWTDHADQADHGQAPFYLSHTQVNPHVSTASGLAQSGTCPVSAEPAAGRGPPARGRHRVASRSSSLAGMRRLLAEHGVRFASFSVIGGFVFVLGLGLQAFLVQACGQGSIVSYLIQGFVSVQVSFLLNYYWTWRDKQVRFWRAGYKFNVQKSVTTIFNLLIYTALVAMHVNYLIANVATTAIFTAINYIIGNFWAFAPSKGKNNCPPPLA
jgi:putative flippase GtrA